MGDFDGRMTGRVLVEGEQSMSTEEFEHLIDAVDAGNGRRPPASTDGLAVFGQRYEPQEELTRRLLGIGTQTKPITYKMLISPETA